MASLSMYPYGYVVNFKGKKEVDEDKAKIVQLIYQKYIEGMNRYAITSYLSEKQILRPRGDNYAWQNSMVRRILEDERYLGNGKFPPLISKEIFEMAKQQRELEKKRIEERRTPGCLPEKKYPFTGFIVCGHCGCNYRRGTQSKNKKTRKISWKCARYIEKGVVNCKYGGNIYEEVLETVCIRAYNRIINDISLIYNRINEEVVVNDNEVEKLNVLITETISSLKQAKTSDVKEVEETLNILLAKRVRIEWTQNRLDLTPYETEKIKKHFEKYPTPMNSFDEIRFKTIFEKIVPMKPGKLQLILRNGTVINEDYIPMRGQVKKCEEV